MRSLGEFGRDSVKHPGELPARAGGKFRRWLGHVWRVRGGGLYALGYIVTFIWFEITTLVDEVASASSVGSFVSEQLGEFIFRFASESVVNMVLAFIWPVYVIDLDPLWGPIGLIALFFGFTTFLKAPIERLLFGEEGATSEAPGNDTSEDA